MPMKAAVLNSIPSPLEIEDISIDRPGPREVLVRTTAAGVCHSDLHFSEGLWVTPTPVVMGHESAGVVEAVGSEVTYVQPGDHVIACVSVFCGACEYCLTGRPALCSSPERARQPGAPPRLSRDGEPVQQFALLAGYAEQLLLHEHGLVKITKDMPLDRAALIGCGVITGVGCVFHTAKVQPGETVAVIGCGGIGLNAVQGAVLAGASRVIAVDLLAAKLERAKQFGATDLVDGSTGDPIAQVKELTGGGVDHAIEAIGAKVAAEQAFAMIKRGGLATVIGMIPQGTKIELPGPELLSKRIQGSTMGSNRFRIDMPRIIDFYLQGRLKLDELVSARLPLEKVNDAFAAMKAGEVARSVLVFE
jgi:S-(hydroxymethyl)glutathione dehydrogenase/alcohol dehydrogenase